MPEIDGDLVPGRRRANRQDADGLDLVEVILALRAAGASVATANLDGVLMVGRSRRNFVMVVSDSPILSEEHALFIRTWRGEAEIVRSIPAALDAIKMRGEAPLPRPTRKRQFRPANSNFGNGGVA